MDAAALNARAIAAFTMLYYRFAKVAPSSAADSAIRESLSSVWPSLGDHPRQIVLRMPLIIDELHDLRGPQLAAAEKYWIAYFSTVHACVASPTPPATKVVCLQSVMQFW